MKGKFQGTWILACLVLLLGLYAYFGEYKKGQDEAHQKETEARVFRLPIEQINSFTLTAGTAEISFLRSTEGWRLEKPLQEDADNESVDSLLNTLANEKILETAKEGENISWAEYGLDKPEAWFNFKYQNGDTLKVEISAKKNFEGNSLLRINSDNKVLVSSAVWSSKAQSKAFDFRRKNLLRTKAASLETLKIKNQKGILDLSLKEGHWVLTHNSELALDQNKIREILAALNETKALEFIIEKKLTATDLQKWNLQQPAISIDGKLKEGQWSAQFAMDKEKKPVALVSEPPFLMRIDAASFSKFNSYSESFVLQKNQAFQLATIPVHKVELNSGLKKNIFISDKDQWKIEPSTPEVEPQFENLKALPERLKDLQALGIYKGSFPKSDQYLILSDEAGKEIFKMEWTVAKKQQWEGQEQLISLVKTNTSQQIWALSETTLAHLKLDQLLQKKSNTEPNKEKTP